MTTHMTVLPDMKVQSPSLAAADAIEAVTKLCRTLIEQQHTPIFPRQDTSTEVPELKRRVDELLEEASERRAAHQAAKDENTRLAKLVESVFLERDSARSVVKEKLQTIQYLEQEIGSRNAQIDGMFDTAEEKSALIKDLEQKLAQLNRFPTTSAGDANLDEVALANVKEELNDAEKKLANLTQERGILTEKLERARVDLAQAGEMHGKITAERDTLAEKVTELEKQAEKTAAEVARLTQAKAAQTVDLNAATMKLAAAEKKLATASAPGKDQDEKIKALDAEIVRLRGLNNDKTKQLRAEHNQRKKFEAIVTEKITALDETVAERDAAVAEARDLRDQGGDTPGQEVKLARAALGRAVRLLTNDADDYAFEPEDRVVLMLSEALTRLGGKEKA